MRIPDSFADLWIWRLKHPPWWVPDSGESNVSVVTKHYKLSITPLLCPFLMDIKAIHGQPRTHTLNIQYDTANLDKQSMKQRGIYTYANWSQHPSEQKQETVMTSDETQLIIVMISSGDTIYSWAENDQWQFKYWKHSNPKAEVQSWWHTHLHKHKHINQACFILIVGCKFPHRMQLNSAQIVKCFQHHSQ